jgi:polyphosphate glucokinase
MPASVLFVVYPHERGGDMAKLSGTSDAAAARILAIDIGGSGLKAAIVNSKGRMLTPRVRQKTPQGCKPEKLVDLLAELVAPLDDYDRIAVGFPGYVRDGKVFTAPNLVTEEWAGFALADALKSRLGWPVRLFNDADLQGLAAISGKGLELVCTLGTGYGTAWFRDGELMPHMELAHIPFRNGKDLDRYLGEKARKKAGDKKWNKRLEKVVDMLSTVLNYDHLYIGGGNSQRVTIGLASNVSIVSNCDGLKGAAFAWFPKV